MPILLALLCTPWQEDQTVMFQVSSIWPVERLFGSKLPLVSVCYFSTVAEPVYHYQLWKGGTVWILNIWIINLSSCAPFLSGFVTESCSVLEMLSPDASLHSHAETIPLIFSSLRSMLRRVDSPKNFFVLSL